MNFNLVQESFARCRDFATSGRVVIFDTETTGLSNCDQIVQIAAVEYVHGEHSRTFSTYVCPTCPMNPDAESVHGLSKAFLAENGISPCEALERFFEFLGKDVLLVGHNIHFDLRMLRNECTAFDFDAELAGVVFCDTIKLAKGIAPGLPNYRLETLIDELGLTGVCENNHNALDDTISCGLVFFKLLRHDLSIHEHKDGKFGSDDVNEAQG